MTAAPFRMGGQPSTDQRRGRWTQASVKSLVNGAKDRGCRQGLAKAARCCRAGLPLLSRGTGLEQPGLHAGGQGVIRRSRSAAVCAPLHQALPRRGWAASFVSTG